MKKIFLYSLVVLLTLVLIAQVAAAAELEFEVVSDQISLDIGEVDAGIAVLDAGSVRQGMTQFSELSFQITNTSAWDQAVDISAEAGDADDGQANTLSPQALTSDPDSGNYALLYHIGQSAPLAFLSTKYLFTEPEQIISNLDQGASQTVWLKLYIPDDTVAGNYTIPITFTAQFTAQ